MSYTDKPLWEACLVLFLVKPITFVFRHKILLLVIIVGIVALVAINIYKSHTSLGTSTAIPAYQEVAPDKTEAPFVIQTSSRVYYVADFTDDGQIITLRKYYIFDRKKWELEMEPLILDRAVYGEIRTYDR